MLFLPEGTRYSYQSMHGEVAAGFEVAEEGMCLAYTPEGNVQKLKPSEGLATDKFAGVSIAAVTVPNSLVLYYKATVAADSTLELKKEPIAGQLKVRTLDGTEIVAGDPASESNSYSLSGKDLTLNADKAETEVMINLKYIPTVTEAVQPQGEGLYRTPGQAVEFGLIGRILRLAQIFTDQYDVSSNWDLSLPVRMGANGLFTQTDAGGGATPIIPNATLLQLPTGDSRQYGYIGIELT